MSKKDDRINEDTEVIFWIPKGAEKEVEENIQAVLRLKAMYIEDMLKKAPQEIQDNLAYLCKHRDESPECREILDEFIRELSKWGVYYPDRKKD